MRLVERKIETRNRFYIVIDELGTDKISFILGEHELGDREKISKALAQALCAKSLRRLNWN